MMKRLSQEALHTLLLSDLGKHISERCSDISKKPLLLNLNSYPVNLRIYLYNCTCPPGGRTPDEYKIQLILENQKRSERCQIDETDGRLVLLVGYAVPLLSVEDGVYVIWDTQMHINAAYSANLQVSLPHLLKALGAGIYTYIKHGNGERMVLCDRQHVFEAIRKRKDWDMEEMTK